MNAIVIDIKNKFNELGVDIPAEKIEERLEKLITKFKVPQEEAKRSVVNFFLKEYNIPRGEFYAGQGEISIAKVADISEDGKWVNLKGKVVQLWENTHESISQVGLLGDETGTIKFIIWASSEVPAVEEGHSYLFKSVVSREWNGKMEINLNKNSSVEAVTDEIEIGTRDVMFTGAMVDIQSGSGLIKRCPQCNRALTKGACAEHGKVDGVYDLRLKAVLDNGTIAQDALLKREVTEELAGISLESAIAMAADALDQGVVLEAMKQKLVGKYYTASGPRVDRYILVESIKKEYTLDSKVLADLINEAEAF